VITVVNVPRDLLGDEISARTLELVANEEWARADRLVRSAGEGLARDGSNPLLGAKTAPAGEPFLTKVTVTTAVRAGDPASEIVLAAEEFGADLVVVGSKGQTGLKGFLIGSVARSVAKRAARPVLVARTPRHGHGAQVVVATDVSERAERAVRFTARLPLPEGVQITVAHVVRPFMPLPDPLAGGSAELQTALADLHRQQEALGAELLTRAQACLAGLGRPVRTELRTGDPATEIITLAEELRADLIIAGARGVSMIEGLLMGSVSDRLLKEASCSVLIVH
jgi:nucleotide-binding universal stress UspA family protein